MRNTKNRYSIQVLSDESNQIREVIEGRMRFAIIDMIYALFEEELLGLCGKRHARGRDKRYYRAGSDRGSVLAQGQKLRVRKPRVKGIEGSDIKLKSYSSLQSYDIICDKVLNYAMRGVSSRNYSELLDDIVGGTGLSKSTVSRAFNKSSRKSLESLNGRDLSKNKFSAIMIDGVVFGSRTVVVSLGITDEGKKLVLGLREGHTENWEVCKDLLESLIARGLCEAKPYLFVIDGSRSLRKAIDRVFGERAAVQRCIHHKERNVLSYLPQERHLEFKRRWKMLHGFNDYSSSQREYNNLLSWLSRINHAAFTSLKEAGMETLTTIKLKVSPLLRRTLSSTNPIESAFSIVRDKVSRVKNWRSSADQVMRWAAVSLVEAEKKFRAIKGYKDLNTLEENLKLLTNNKNKRNQTLSSA